MNDTSNIEDQKTAEGTVQTLFKWLLKHRYTELFWNLCEIDQLTRRLAETHAGCAVLRSAPDRMAAKMDEMFQYDLRTIYPLLVGLEREAEKAGSCKPFKTSRMYIDQLLFDLQQLKEQLAVLINSQKEPSALSVLMNHLMNHLIVFGQLLINLRRDKEQMLFKPFRNCSQACKVL